MSIRKMNFFKTFFKDSKKCLKYRVCATLQSGIPAEWLKNEGALSPHGGELFYMWLFVLTSGSGESKITFACRNGGMADAHGSGPCEVKFMWVQVPFPALSGGF